MGARGWRCTVAYAVALAASAILTGCAGGSGPDVDVLGSWRLVSGSTTDGPLRVPDGSRVTLTFEEGSAGGRGPCNDYGGDYEVDGDRLDFPGDGISQTLVGCDGGAGALESAYISSLSRIDRVARDGDTLTLTGEDTEVVLQRLAQWPRAEVVGRTWRLVSWTDHAGTEHRPHGKPGLRPSLRIDEKGRRGGPIEVSTGCRTMTGRWVDWRDSIAVVRSSWAGTCPQDLMPQERVIANALSEPTLELRGGELVLRGAHESGPAEAVWRAR